MAGRPRRRARLARMNPNSVPYDRRPHFYEVTVAFGGGYSTVVEGGKVLEEVQHGLDSGAHEITIKYIGTDAPEDLGRQRY